MGVFTNLAELPFGGNDEEFARKEITAINILGFASWLGFPCARVYSPHRLFAVVVPRVSVPILD